MPKMHIPSMVRKTNQIRRTEPRRVTWEKDGVDEKVVQYGLYGIGHKGIAKLTKLTEGQVGYRLGKADVSVSDWRRVADGNKVDETIAMLEGKLRRASKVIQEVRRNSSLAKK